MAIGYAFNGHCYPDGDTLHLAFRNQCPTYDGMHINVMTSSSVNLAGIPIITYSISSRSLDNATAPAARTGTFITTPCAYPGQLDLNDVFASPSLQDASNAWAAGFLTPMLVGLVAWAVSRVLRLH